MEDNNTYLVIEMFGEENIGFINAGILDAKLKRDKFSARVVTNVEIPLVNALESYFDCNVTIIGHNVVSMNFVKIEYDVIVKAQDGDRQEKVYLSETFYYSNV